MGAENQRLVRQCRQPGKRIEHLRGSPFEDASAAACKQGITTKEMIRRQVTQVPRRMSRHWNHLKHSSQRRERHPLATAQAVREACDRLPRRTKHLDTGMRQQVGNPALMVLMMMRHEDGLQRHPLTLERFQDRTCITGVDNNRRPAFAQQPDVVILERGYSNDVKHGPILKEQREMSITGIDEWLSTTQGRYVITWEQDKIDAVVDDLFGYNALQLGLPQIPFLANNRIPLRQIAGETGKVDVLCDLRELPFAANSIDLVILPHVLEFHDDRHQILREVERILIPDGQLVITGFNPLSLWGVRNKLPGSPDTFPMNGKYISVLRLKDWLQLLNFEVDRGNFGCYAPPCQNEKWLRRWSFLEAAGDRWWSFAGGVYMLRAIKRVRGIRMIMPDWNQKKAPAKAFTPIIHKESEKRVL